MAYKDTILADSPVLYFSLEESTGNPVNQGSHTGLTGWGISGVTRDVAGKVDKGFAFATKTAYVNFAHGTTNNAAYTDQVYTYEVWVKPAASTSNDYIVVLGNITSGHYSYIYKNNTGKATFYSKGSLTTGRGAVGTSQIDDGNWHHLALVHNGSVKQLYVDGVLEATESNSIGTFSPAAQFTLGWYSGPQSAAGSYDEFAVYNAALSGSQILAHYNAANAPVGTNAGYTAEVMTASALTTDAVGGGNVRRVAVTEDAYINSSDPTTNYASNPSGSLSGERVLIKIPSPTLAGGEAVSSTKLALTRYGSGYSYDAQTITISRITSDWSEGTVTWNTAPTFTVVKTVTVPSGAAGASYEVDISDVLASTNYGVQITSGIPAYPSESGALGPKAVYAITPATAVDVTASPVTAAAAMPPATPAGGTGASVPVGPMSATATVADAVGSAGATLKVNVPAMYVSAAMPNAVATTETFIDLSLEAEPMDAYAEVSQGGGFASPKVVAAEVMTAVGTTTDAAVDTTRGVRFTAPALSASAIWKQPASINGAAIVASEVDDKFFQRALGLEPSSWFRLNDAGSTAVNRIKPGGVDGTYTGVLTGQHNGPDGRHSVYFTGSSQLSLNNPTGPQGALTNATLEFSFRTTKRDQFIMVGSDETSGTGSVTEITREIVMRNGRLVFRAYNSANRSQDAPDLEFSSFRDLADGEWHTVAFRSVDTDVSNSRSIDGIELYIDGKFEMRRGSYMGIGFPDYIGSRPSTLAYDNLPPLPSSQNFVGDMSEVVLFNRTITTDDITRLYYDFMGWNPIEVDSIDSFAFMTADNRGRGNQKRALVLVWDAEEDGYNFGAGGNSGTMNFDPLATVRLGSRGLATNNLEGYKVFQAGVTAIVGGGGQYRDAVYDRPTLIDLEQHVDIQDYDVIMFSDWPDEGVEEDRLRSDIPNYTADKERLLRQLRDANDKGVGLLVTHPRLAVDLGIIDRVEYVPTLKESYGSAGLQNPNNMGFQGNAAGLYDYGSAVKFPWNITSDAQLAQGSNGAAGTGEAMNNDPDYLDYKAYFFGDQNFNNRFRVRALVDGLTNIPAYIIKDAAYHVDVDVWGDDFGAFNLEDRRAGLVIGDEFIFNGTNVAGLDWDSFSNLNLLEYGRPFGYYAVPVSNVKAGTVVTTFGATHWRGKSQVENPYKDYATTVALDRGDVLAGRAVGGRIFVSFTEAPGYLQQSLPVDILPDSEWDDGTAVWPTNYTPDTAAQRDWERSGTRISVGNTSVGGRIVETSVTMPDGSTAVVRAPSGTGDGLITANYRSLFGTAYVPRWDMTRRGMWWVGRGEKPVEGEVRIGSESLEATAAMPQPTVTAQRDGGFKAEPMVGLAQVTRVAESTIGDVDVRTLPVTARAEFTGFSRVISAEPMEAEAEIVENFDMVHATGEQVVLTLHGVDATLYLKEETN